MRNIAVFFRAFGFGMAYGGVMSWAIHQFGRDLLSEKGLDEFGLFMLTLGGIGMVLGLLLVLVLGRIKPRC